MQLPKRISKSRGLVALLAVASLVMLAAPAAESQDAITGTGTGTEGWEYPRANPNPDCTNPPFDDLNDPIPMYGKVPGDEWELGYTATLSSTTSMYVGPIDVDISVDVHWIGPAGVGTVTGGVISGNCELNPRVPISSARVYSPSKEGGESGEDADEAQEQEDPVTGPGGEGTGYVECLDMNDTDPAGNISFYSRQTSAVEFHLYGSCTIKGNAALTGVTTAPIHIVITGTMTPCADPFMGTPNVACIGADIADPRDDNSNVAQIDEWGSHLVTTLVAGGTA